MWRFAWVMVAVLLIMPVLAGCSATSDSMRASASGDGAADGSGGASGAYGASGGNGSAMVQAGGGRDGRAVDAYGRVNPKAYSAVASLDDIHFDFDSYDIRPDAAKILETSARWLKDNPRHLVLIEGHADERGTNEYNIALGDRRARAAMNYLVSHGVSGKRISRISYGEERAACKEHTEDCWAKNRRAHFSVKAQ